VEGQVTGCGAVREMEEPGLRAWWPSAVAVQAEAANHPELPRSRAVVVSVVGNVAPLSAAGVDHEGEREQTTDDVSKEKVTSKPGMLRSPGTSLAGACRLARRCPALRWRERGPGSRAERVNLSPRARGRPVALCWPAAGSWKREPQAAETASGRVVMRGTGAGRLVVAGKPGNADGAKGTGRPGWLGGQPPLAGGAG
jgi:hypothetical protein